MQQLTTDIDWREIDGEIVVLDRRQGCYLAVNPAGAFLWPALIQGATEETLVERLVDRYRVERDRARQDVNAFLEWLAERGLLAR